MRVPTRTRILEASVELFGARGVDAVSLDEIAAVVGVRKQTVLYWFATKDELVDAVFADAAAQLGTAIEAAGRAAPDDPLDRIDSIVMAVFGRRPNAVAARVGSAEPAPRSVGCAAAPSPPALRRPSGRSPRNGDGRRTPPLW